ncbi:phage tail protein [Aureitalea sp. L0-47]|jgi:microcystin-dependent protein|uniref:phage tail protein n=1 Tax=Aureitalea sp. L0-47 TaxID=2816962 RepID=UPI00223800D5|nr:tail fiber protein [Aureitalea sp. L0-47]MCW5520268.1 phage tail protein [Aureitalea sp. L0-47]
MEPFVGQIQAFGFNFAPRGWAQCAGQLLPIAQNQALFSLLGTIYGGDGRTTFALPDLRGRSIVGEGNGPGLSNITMGEKGGTETITLNANNVPAHAHGVSVPVSSTAGEEGTANGQVIADHAGGFNEDVTAGAALKAFNTANAGNGQAFGSRNPFLGINVCIALIGTYPSRN